MNSMSNDFVNRTYRGFFRSEDLVYFQVKFKQTDLLIGVTRESYTPDLANRIEQRVTRLRAQLETYIASHPEFLTSLEPVILKPGAPEIALRMSRAARLAGVGPMAAVAGAFAEEVGRLLDDCPDLIVENGGDLYIRTTRERLVGVIAGNSPFSNRIAVRIKPGESPLGVCTSSGTVGPSLSLGRADAAMVKATSASLADAVATGAGNRVLSKDKLMAAVDYAQGVPGVTGILVIKDDQMAAWGNIELTPINSIRETDEHR
ncbi:MAG: UPF0280 family protein [Bacillota bacterium]